MGNGGIRYGIGYNRHDKRGMGSDFFSSGEGGCAVLGKKSVK